MTYFEFQKRKYGKEKTENYPYVYLTKSYRDKNGKVQKNRIYLAKNINKRKFSSNKKCKKCGEKKNTLFKSLCANCLAKKSIKEIKKMKDVI